MEPGGKTDRVPRFLRRRILVDAKFQGTWAAGIVGLAIALLAVLGGLYLGTLSEQRRLMGVNNLCLGTPGTVEAAEDREFDADLRGRLEEEDSRSLLHLVVSAAVLVVLLAAIAVRLTFHVAGPARAVSTMLKHLAEGDPDPVRHLRKGDQFAFLVKDVRTLHDALGRRCRAEADLMDEAAALLEERPGAASEMGRRLRDTAAEKRQRYPQIDD